MTIPQQTGGGNSTTLVAVKKLQSAADEATKKDFIREIRIMSKLRHDNIVQVSVCVYNKLEYSLGGGGGVVTTPTIT